MLSLEGTDGVTLEIWTMEATVSVRPEETWGHAMDVLDNDNSDVYVYHAHLERKRRVAGRAGKR